MTTLENGYNLKNKLFFSFIIILIVFYFINNKLIIPIWTGFAILFVIHFFIKEYKNKRLKI